MKSKNLFTTLVLLIAGTVGSQAQVLLSTSFEAPGYTVGALTNANGVTGQDGWNGAGFGGNPQVENSLANSGAQAISFNASGAPTNGCAEANLSFTDAGPSKAVDAGIYMYEPNLNSSWVPIGLYSVSGLLASIWVTSSGAYVFNNSTQSVAVPVTAGSWNYFRIHIDFTAQTATGYLNEVLIGSLPFGVTAHDLSTVIIARFKQSTGTPNTAYFDDLSIVASPVTYYFPEIALGGGWQNTLTYVNNSPRTVTCTTNFYTQAGAPLSVPFSQGTISSRTDILQPGDSLHDQSQANVSGSLVVGWVAASCDAPVAASLLFRLYQGTPPVPSAEVGVPAMAIPATQFVTFAQTETGVAYANPSTTQAATVTFTATSSAGVVLGSVSQTLQPMAEAIGNVGPMLGLSSFTGWLKISSTIPIVSFSINFEAYPVISAMPPGQLSN
jgi:hypothetical protein